MRYPCMRAVSDHSLVQLARVYPLSTGIYLSGRYGKAQLATIAMLLTESASRVLHVAILS